jgi:hypothetical protein
MIHSSHRDRKTKAIAEVLAMIADAHPELAPNHPRAVRETDEWLWEDATEFCAALDRYAGRTGPRKSSRGAKQAHLALRSLLRMREVPGVLQCVTLAVAARRAG